MKSESNQEYSKGLITVSLDDDPDRLQFLKDTGQPPPTFAFLSADDWGEFAQVVIRMEGKTEYNREGIANLRRLAACWNAMHGIEDPEAFVQSAQLVADNWSLAHNIPRAIDVMEQHMKGGEE